MWARDLEVSVEGGRWRDKIHPFVLAFVTFWPPVVAVGWGIIRQGMLFGEVKREVAAFLARVKAEESSPSQTAVPIDPGNEKDPWVHVA